MEKGDTVMRRLPFLIAALFALAIAVPQAFAEGRTVVGTISKIDLESGAFTVTDGMGVGWNYKVLSDTGIDLSEFREGDRVTVSIGRATPLNMMSSADYVRKGDRIVKTPPTPY